MRHSRGFTLIELMITVAIIAILAAIAIPSYSQYVLRGKISDAVAGLSDQRLKMEQFFQDNRSYANACMAGTVAPPQPATPNFTFASPPCSISADGLHYTVTATGINRMTGAVYTINELGIKTSTFTAPFPAWPGSTSCWVLKSDGSC